MRKLGYALLGLLLLAQLVPLPRDNPPVVREVDAPPAVHAALRHACYDCHSNQTRWPFYAYVAPASWLVAYDVRAGRKKLNFSDWGRHAKERDEIGDVLADDEMPPWFYRPLHPEARLRDDERAAIKAWASVDKAHGAKDDAE
jgi:hypothetical protein